MVPPAFVNYLPLLDKEFGVMAADTSILLLDIGGLLLPRVHARNPVLAAPVSQYARVSA